MRIAELTAYHVRIPLRKTIRHASYSRREHDYLIVRCRLDDGTEGWGEGLPRPYVTGESIETAWDQVRDLDLTVLAEPLDGLPSALAACREFRMSDPPRGRRDCFGHSVRCAVESTERRRRSIPI